MNILTIDKNEFQKGNTFDDEDESGGISPNSICLNYFLGEGFVLIPWPSYTPITTEPTDDVIDSCVDPASISPADAFIVDKDGEFFILDGTTLTLKHTDSAKSYIYGTTRIITFQNEIFCTSSTDITHFDIFMTTLNNVWWTSTQGKTALSTGYRHPMAVVEDTLYIADVYKIHTWNGASSVYEAMTLPTSYNITEMITSADGRYLLAFASENANYNHVKKSNAKLFIIDTVTLEFIREIDLEDQVETAMNVGGTTYVIYGKSFGYLSDNGLKLIRKLDISDPVYKGRVTVMDNSIFIVEDDKILVYGDVNGKGKIFFYVAKSEYPYNKIKNILAIGNTGIDDNKLLLSYLVGSVRKVRILDFDDRGVGDAILYTKKYRKGKVWIRRIEIETETLASGDSLEISYIKSDGNYSSIGTFSHTLNGAVQTGRFECNALVDFIQIRLVWSNFAVKSIKIYYESGE